MSRFHIIIKMIISNIAADTYKFKHYRESLDSLITLGLCAPRQSRRAQEQLFLQVSALKGSHRLGGFIY